MPEEAFEPTVIFFGLTNSPATFQVIMNDLLRDMIKVEDIAAFIDDVMVGIETEKEHNKIVKEILRRIAENNLFVKLEKYIWKVREVEFLEVIIRLDSMRIEKEKVQGIINWLMLRSVKNIQKFLRLENYYR